MTPPRAPRTLRLVTLHPDAARAALDRILTEPTPDGLWQLQKALLVTGGEQAAQARTVARAFHACLRALRSKAESRSASRWGAVLGTAAVASVTLPDMLQELPLIFAVDGPKLSVIVF